MKNDIANPVDASRNTAAINFRVDRLTTRKPRKKPNTIFAGKEVTRFTRNLMGQGSFAPLRSK